MGNTLGCIKSKKGRPATQGGQKIEPIEPDHNSGKKSVLKKNKIGENSAINDPNKEITRVKVVKFPATGTNENPAM
jgi:hypothetical protein